MNPDNPMDFDSLQKAWHSQSSQTRVTIDADLLRREVQRSDQSFRAVIFGRDFRELAVGLVMLPVWFYLGHRNALPWTWWLAIPAITWVCLFIVVDRIRHKPRCNAPGESLLGCVNSSLAQVEHQIWLLRNVFWWYLLPFTIAILAFFTQVAWQRGPTFGAFLVALAPSGLFLFVLYGFLYYLNQRAVRRDLVPRRDELLALRASLGDETADHAPAVAVDDLRNPGVFRQALLVTVLTTLLVPLMFFVDGLIPYRRDHSLRSNRGTPAPFARLVTDLRREKKLVGLAAMVSVDGKVIASAVDGERTLGSGVEVELNDRWHLGAIAQTVTATMIARLVESGEVKWTTTVGECFLDASIHADWKPVTLYQLVTNTAGAPDNFPTGVMFQKPALGVEATRARRQSVLDVLAKKPVRPPGDEYKYSNVSATIAAAMIEERTGKTWDDLVQREVYTPLALNDSGFGPPPSPGDSQPYGHRVHNGAKLAVGDDIDNTFIIAPAASVHMSLADLAAFATEHLQGEHGAGQLLEAESYERLHATVLGPFACGWIKYLPTKKLPYTVYWQNGSNTMWYALVVRIPEKNMVVAVTANDGDYMAAESAAWEIVEFAASDLQPAAAEFPKLAPYAAIRWQDTQPEVELDGDWVRLVAIDALPTADIVAFCQKTYGDLWKKRFEEDLVEVLTRMGRPPQVTVQLIIQTLGNPSKTRTLNNVPMTAANRSAIYSAAQSRADP